MIINSYRYASAAWTPASVSGLYIWNRYGTQLFQDTGGSTPATATSDPVALWKDQSSNVNNMSQGTAGSRGTLQADGSVGFDGSADFLESTSALTLKPATIFCLVYANSVSGNQAVVSGASGGLGIDLNGTTIRLMHTYNAQLAAIGSTSMPSAAWTRLIASYDGSGNYVMYVDGVNHTSGTNSVAIGSAKVRIAAGPAEYFNCRIADWGVYDSALSGGDVTLLDGYLSDVQAGL